MDTNEREMINPVIEKLTDWANEPTVSDLKQDFKDAQSDHQLHTSKVSTYLDNLNVTGSAVVKTRKGRSKVVPKLIRKQAEWRYASLSEPFLSTDDLFDVDPVTYEDKDAAYQNALVLNNQFNTKINKVKFIDDYVRTAVDEGTVICKVGWKYSEKEVEVEVEQFDYEFTDDPEYIEQLSQLDQLVQSQSPELANVPLELMNAYESSIYNNAPVKPVSIGFETTTEVQIVENYPTVEVCDYRNVLIDPTCKGDINQASFVIYSFETSMAELKKDGRYKNLDAVNVEAVNPLSEPDHSTDDLTAFRFSDKPRKRIVAYEYWGFWDIEGNGLVEPIVATYVGDVLIRLERNPFPDQKLPFVVCQYLPVRNSVYGEPDGVLLEDNQKIIGAVTRGMIDTMGRSANGQMAVRKDALDVSNRRKFDNGEDYEFNATVDPRQAFHMHTYPEIPQSASLMLQLQNAEAESLTGIKAFSSGISGQALGNMLDINTDIPLIDGSWKKLVDVVDGDVLVGSNGKGTTVLKAHEIKLPEVAYDMHFDNGAVVKSGGEHLWTIKVDGTAHNLREWHTVDADTVYEHIKKGRRVTIPRMKEIHTGKPTGNSINPYVLGYWLGDGMSHSSRITTEDTEVVAFFKDAGYECVSVKDSSKCGNATMYDVYKIGYEPKRNALTGRYEESGSLHSELKEIGLHARYGGHKHIPEEYFTATYEEKMELIRGLMDSDGYAHSGAFVQFSQSESQLKDDVVRLLKSLGLKVSIIKRDMDTRNKQNQARCEVAGNTPIWHRKDSYEVGFTPWSNPFKITRKASKWKLPHKKTVTLKAMKIVDEVPMRCLTVDSQDKLFAVTDKFVLTHNTATGIRSALDATAKRELNILRRLAKGVKDIGRKIISMNAEFLSEEEVVRITNEEFITIRRDDLAGNFDLKLSISTPEADEQKASELAFMLQTTAQSMGPMFTQIILADIAKLRKMPELAKRIKDYAPEPDPLAQRKAELEIALLEAQIENERNKGIKQYASANLDMARVNTEEAKTGNLNSDTDLKNLDFVEQETGTKQARNIQLENTRVEGKAALNSLQNEFKRNEDSTMTTNGMRPV